jgi:hypothetical protein
LKSRGIAILTGAIFFSTLIAIPPMSHADGGPPYDEQWVCSGLADPTMVGYVKQVAPELRYVSNSILINSPKDSSGKILPVNSCSDALDPNCSLTDFQNYYALLPKCVGSTDIDCIMQISASLDGKPLVTKDLGYFPTKDSQSFTGNPSLNLPTGSTSSLVEIPDAPHPGGDIYMVKAQMYGALRLGWRTNIFRPLDFNVEIFAVSFKDGSYNPDFIDTKSGKTWQSPTLWNMDQNSMQCVARSSTQCALPVPLPTNVRFGVQFRLSNMPVSWLQGRFRDPDVHIGQDSLGSTILTIAAQPIKVPILALAVSQNNLLPEMYSPISRPQGVIFNATDQDSSLLGFSRFLAWLSASSNVAAALPTSWSFRSTFTNYGQYDLRTLKCFGTSNDGFFDSAPEFRGLVTTNASQYVEGPPQFNQRDQTLDYKVAAPHFQPNGEVFKGTYNLVVSDTFARCIYGFTNAPIQATISITSETGEQEVATTIVGEKDGLLYLAANGFTFSAPVIRVKLTQEKIVPTVFPTPSATFVPEVKGKSKSTIKCTKGKVIKKIVGVKPVCPSGYKPK